MPEKKIKDERTERRIYIAITVVALALAAVLFMVVLFGGGQDDSPDAANTPFGSGQQLENGDATPSPGGSSISPDKSAPPELSAEPSVNPSIEPSAEPSPSAAPSVNPSAEPQDDETAGKREYTIELTDSQASTLVAMALRDYAESASAHFISPDTLEVDAEVMRDKALEFIEEEHKIAAAIARAILPETLDAEVEVQLYVEDGLLRAHIVRAEALGRDISGYLPSGVEGKLNDAISEALPDSAELISVEVGDGEAKFTVEM